MRRISEENQSSAPRIDLDAYRRMLWRNKHYVLIPAALAGMIAGIGVRFIAPVYKSASLIAIEDQTFLSPEVEQFVTLPASTRRQMQDEDTLLRLAAELRSSAFLDALIDHLGIAKDPQLVASARLQAAKTPGSSVDEIVMQKLRGRLNGKIEVSLEGPGMFRISAYDYNSEACYMIANAATTVYVDVQRKKQLKGLDEAVEFGDEQLILYKQRLQDSELKLEQLEKQIADRETEDHVVTEPSLRHAETLKQQLIVKIGKLEDTVARLRARIHSVIGETPKSDVIWEDPELADIRDGLVAHRETVLRLELEGRALTTPQWEESKSGILEDEDALQRRLSVLVNIHHPEIEADHRPMFVEYLFQVLQLESHRAHLSMLETQIIMFQQKQGRLPEMEMERSRLSEQVRTDRELYNSFIRAKTSTQISQAIQQTGLSAMIEVMDQPKRPTNPVKPDKKTIIILAILFGAGLGVSGMVVSEYSDTSFRRVEDIEELLGLRVLGTIPSFESGVKWNQGRLRKQTLIWAAVSVVIVTVSLFGFYFYGKAAEKQAIDIFLTRSTSSVGDRQ